jgi:hypothetical protein
MCRKQLKSEVDSMGVVNAQRSHCVREYHSKRFRVYYRKFASSVAGHTFRFGSANLILYAFLISPIHGTYFAQLILDLVTVISDNELK